MKIAWLVQRACASNRLANGPTGGTSHFNNQKSSIINHAVPEGRHWAGHPSTPTFSGFAVQILPRSLESPEAGTLVEFMAYTFHKILRNELDLAHLVVLTPLGRIDDREVAPTDRAPGHLHGC